METNAPVEIIFIITDEQRDSLVIDARWPTGIKRVGGNQYSMHPKHPSVDFFTSHYQISNQINRHRRGPRPRPPILCSRPMMQAIIVKMNFCNGKKVDHTISREMLINLIIEGVITKKTNKKSAAQLIADQWLIMECWTTRDSVYNNLKNDYADAFHKAKKVKRKDELSLSA